MENWKETPIYITNFNNLERGFRKLVNWLRDAGQENIIVIDNASSWEPLLNYYETCGLQIINKTANLGHDAFWKLNIPQSSRFIVTDPDVVPDINCPKDLVRKMHEVADRYSPAKVGPGLRIDNLPDHYHRKQLMLDSECNYWTKKTSENDCFHALIDTTFALYEPGWGIWAPAAHIRLDFPYVCEHLPWYEDSSKEDEERDFYKKTALPGISNA
jgi:hypothetical protein